MDPELTKLESEFKKNIDQWLSKQGILFQLKHASAAGAILPKICGLLFRVFVLIAIALGVFWFYLTNHVGSEAYKEKVTENLVASLNASKGEIKSIERHKGGLLNAQMLISNFQLDSSETSFFEDWYVSKDGRDLDGAESPVSEKKKLTAHSVTIQPLGLGDGIISNWSGKKISVGILSCHLKTGAESDKAAKASYLSIFKDFDQLTVNNVTIEEAHIGWGYDISKGSIKGAVIEALRKGDTWYLTINNGQFSHGWLENANIESMTIECHKSGLVKVVEAKLRFGEGVLSFNADIKIQARPEVSGNFSFKSIKVLDLVGQAYAPYLSGQVTGEGSLKGHLNTTEGVSTKAKITLDAELVDSNGKLTDEEANIGSQERMLNEAFLIVKSKFPILATMRELNKVNSYNQLKLNQGGFVIEHKGGETTISDIDVRSGDFLVIKGALKYAWSKVKNKKEAEVDLDSGLNETLIDQTDIGEIADEEIAVHKLVRTISGNLRMGFVTDVFDDHPEILEIYPEEADTLRVWLPVKMQGELKDATTEIADRLNKIVQDARAAKENE